MKKAKLAGRRCVFAGLLLLGFMLPMVPERGLAADRKSSGDSLPPIPKPSENKGKPGTYQAKTSHEGCNYYVYVPKSYSDDNPAGLHLYFHGQGGQGGASGFGQWATQFLEGKMATEFLAMQ